MTENVISNTESQITPAPHPGVAALILAAASGVLTVLGLINILSGTACIIICSYNRQVGNHPVVTVLLLAGLVLNVLAIWQLVRVAKPIAPLDWAEKVWAGFAVFGLLIEAVVVMMAIPGLFTFFA